MNVLKTLPMLAGLFVGGFFLSASDTAHAQEIIRESRTDGKREHKRVGKKTTSQAKRGKKTTTVKRTHTSQGHSRVTSHTRVERHHRPVHNHTTHHRTVVSHPHGVTHRTHYVHPRYHRSYRYVYYPRYQSYHHHHTNVVYVEVEREPELPELDCPLYTEAVVTDRETYCATDRGTRHGPFVRYHNNGEVAEEGLYEHGTKEGVWVSYHANGSIRSEGAYHHGEREGEWLNFNRDGEEISRTLYR